MAFQRIVSLVPSQTELLFALGLDEEIAGITKFCLHPADKVVNKTRVGGTKTVHLDRIHALKPDFILANKEENTREQIEELQKRYPVLVTDPASVPEALNMIRTVAAAVEKEEQGEALADRIGREFERLSVWRESRVGADARRVAYFIWKDPWMVAAGGTFIHSMLEAAGFVNVFGDRSRYPVVNAEEVRAARPDWLFLSSEPYPFGQKHLTEWPSVCPGARSLLVDGELFSWYGSRMLHSVAYFWELHQRLLHER